MKVWRYIEQDQVPADLGLATDEFLLSYYAIRGRENPPSPTLRLYTYRPHCALVGRFQNLPAELNLEYCRQHDIQVGRRPTGGGAILMGPDQLGVCLVLSTKQEPELANPALAYQQLARPLIQALQQLGIHARFRPKNDLEVQGRKIAGLGVYYDAHGGLLFHASLLVDLDIPLMLRVLNIPREKYSDRVMIRSVRQRLTTVRRETGKPISLDQVRQLVQKSFASLFQVELQARGPSREEARLIRQLALQKYASPEWLFQQSPQMDMTGTALKRTRVGLLRIYLALKGQCIKSVLIAGDYFDYAHAFRNLEAALKWHPLSKEEIRATVRKNLSGQQLGLEEPDQQVLINQVVEAIMQASRSARVEHRFTYRGSCYYPAAKAASTP